MRKPSQLVRMTGVMSLAIGLTAAVVPLASGATAQSASTGTAHPGSGRPGPGGRAAAVAVPGVNRAGYITVSGGIKLAYDLTLPSATGRFPVALEYNDYTSGADNGAHQPGTDAGDLLAAGFAVLGVNQPGSGCSGGDLRPYQAHTQAGYQPLTPRKRVYARVELFPFEHVFRKGSSIRITIGSATGTAQSTGVWGLSGLQAPFSDTVYTSASQQSEVVLGLIPGATAKVPLPTCGSIIGEPCRPSPAPVPSGSLTVPGTR